MLSSQRGRRSGRRVRSCLALILIASTLSAQAALLTWIDPAGGAAQSPTNWNPQQLPTAIDSLLFSLNNNYTVSWSNVVISSTSHTYRAGSVTHSIAFPHRIGANMIVGWASGDSAGARITTGEIDVSGNVSVGSGAGSTGSLSIIDDDAFLLLDMAGSDLTVGDAGDGSLFVQGGGQVQVEDDIFIGRLNGSVGNVIVSGASVTPAQGSALIAVGPDSDIILGGISAGTGTLTVMRDTLVFTNRDLLVAPTSASTGTVTVSDGGNGAPAEIQVNRNLDIARNTTAVNAGMGTVNIDNGGTISVSGATNVGDTQGNVANVGTLNITGNGQLFTGSLIFTGFTGFGFQSGLIRVDGGTFDPPGAPGSTYTLEGAGNPTLELVNGGHATLSNGFTNALRLGVNNPATLRILSGSSISITTEAGNPSDAQIGANAVVVIDGASSALDGDRNMTITGSTTDVTAGGRLESFNLAFSDGTHTITGTNSRLVAGGTLTNQNDSQLSLGTGATGQAGSMANAAPLSIATGAALTVTNTMTNIGPVSLTGGTITAGTLDFNDAGNLVGRGTVTARVLMDSPAAFISNSGGSLNLGNASDTAGFFSTGTLNIGGNTARLFDSDAATVGNVTLAGGVMECANGGLLAAGTSVMGSGRIQHALTNQGTITPTGTGLQWAGALTGTGQGIAGTLMRFLNGGSFSGAGLIDADIDADPGSTLTATGNLTMGRATSTSGITLDGALSVGAHNVTLRDSNTALLGNITIAGGTLAFPNGALLPATRTLSGNGIISDDMINLGAIASTGSGLLIDGLLTSAGPTITGDRITFRAGGGFSGSGLMDLPVTSQAASSIEATGALTMGRSTSAAGVALGGSLDVGAQTVTLLDSGSAQLGTDTTLAGGTLVAANGLLLLPGGVLSGNGDVSAPIVNTLGIVEPGSSIGVLHLTGRYTERPPAELRVEIGGLASYDELRADGHASVTGILRADFIGGFVPTLGDRFPVLSAAGVDGTYAQVVPSGLPFGMTAVALYSPDTVFVQIVADTDGDGSPDFADCAPADPGSFAEPADPGMTVTGGAIADVAWTSQIPTSGAKTVHDVLRGDPTALPVDGGETCLVAGTTSSAIHDALMPAPGAAFFYLSRGRNACATPGYGFESDGTPRISSACP